MVAEVLLQQLAGARPDPIRSAIDQLLPTIQQAQLRRQKQKFDALQIKKLEKELERQEKIENIISTSIVDGEFDSDFASNNLKRAGFVDVAQQVEANQAGIDFKRTQVRKQLAGLKTEQIERKDLEARQVGEVFGNVLSASPDNLDTAFENAVNTALQFGSEFFDQNDLKEAKALTDPEEKQEFAREFFFNAGTFSEQARVMLQEQELEIRSKQGPSQLSTDKLTAQILQKIFNGQRQGKSIQQMLQDKTLVKSEFNLVLDNLGGTENINLAMKLAEINPQFIRKVIDGDVSALGDITRMAKILKIGIEDITKKNLDKGLVGDRKSVSDFELNSANVEREFLIRVMQKNRLPSERDALRFILLRKQQGRK